MPDGIRLAKDVSRHVFTWSAAIACGNTPRKRRSMKRLYLELAYAAHTARERRVTTRLYMRPLCAPIDITVRGNAQMAKNLNNFDRLPYKYPSGRNNKAVFNDCGYKRQ